MRLFKEDRTVKITSRPSVGQTAILACSFLACVTAAQHVMASSGDAWEEFQQDVEKACLEAAKDVLLVGTIRVDPYGSESYGFAVMVGIEPGTSNQRLIACAYDKQSQVAEISGYLDI